MKTLVTTALIAFATFTATAQKQTKTVHTDESQLVWKGYKVTGSHEGTIAIQSGALEFENDVLVGGEFVVDMTTLGSTDLSGEYKDKLDGHLKSDDFFGVATYPTATLTFSKVTPTGKNAYQVQGDLTIKGRTNPVTFELSVYGSKANAALKVDRAKYDVRYGSASFFDNLKDKTIYDEFDLVADLQF
ncbi:lipid-binding protein [Mangrovimonas yunxiaonensis]|uniref:Lipid-binding protein n=1 Tax=Mangrovimonas yunxiaonensis TaxID=1197477 RepID=A0A084TJI7_9FLAO|nr:YceI family protein [Mangrovimonas yunxiaonensis]KFB00873.1 lipid-binding protein [Mangrovimonas yunxiaonensis]MBR9757819.1 YceI family protein [Algicola sp.]GGH43925.1 lipid-binding protein [Mangrovimonas yunxiaonensis]